MRRDKREFAKSGRTAFASKTEIWKGTLSRDFIFYKTMAEVRCALEAMLKGQRSNGGFDQDDLG